ncbi:hypothetical protein KP509_21G082400 [Ceratopteris richardii]|uniref:JmjC domain-containing protein n=1 Tax=Ceratopteris richardii TaxID=49495 RepID=A0A8T2SCH7_CERRI|nr:hypothetical protein KP509_21G082400 [Ceratopteris richardii]KAH7316199.1 hypothetical protein KP509_21G082400 [Ceratopteris richardii]
MMKWMWGDGAGKVNLARSLLLGSRNMGFSSSNQGIVAGAPVSRVHAPRFQDFIRDWFQPQFPVVIESAMENWKARSWTLDTLIKKFGQTTVHIELSRWHKEEKRWADFRDLYKDKALAPKEEIFIPQYPILLEDFINIFLRDYEDQTAPVKGYLAQQQLLNDLPELAEGIEDPEYANIGSGIYQRNVWLGPAGTITPLHRDPYHNVLAQVWGSKYIRVYAPTETEKLYPFKTNLYLRNTSEVSHLLHSLLLT